MRRGVVLPVLVALLTAPASVPAGAPAPVHVDEDLRNAEGPVSAIVTFEDAPPPATLDAVRELGTLHTTYTIIDAAHVTLPAERVDRLAALDAVTRVDEDEPLEHHLDTSKAAIQADERLFQKGYTGANVTIAVVDTGIDSTHPAMDERVERGVKFTGQGGDPAESDSSTDTDGHGTHVAGITGSDGSSSQTADPDDTSYKGVAPDVGLVSLDISASFTTSTAIRAFEWVHNNHEAYDIHVVQNSWGRKETGQAYEPDDPAIQASNALIAEDDQVVVFSAGNAGPGASTLSMEAANPNVIAVAATNDRGDPADFSSRGPVVYENGTQAAWTKPDVAAPGVRITSAASSQTTDVTTRYKDLSGTSQAAPHVAGVAALIRDQAPDLPARAIHDVLERTARDLGEDGPDPVTGHGLVNAPRALEDALEAANGSLSSNTQVYTANGTLTAAPAGTGLLDEDGASVEAATGTFPVAEDATRLDFRFTWNATEGDRPNLNVRLTDPSGRDMLVPSEDGVAERTVEEPTDGDWGWRAEPASTADIGTVDYEKTATVTYPDQDPLRQTGSSGSGFFDDTFRDQAQRAYQDAADAFGQGPVVAALAALGVLLVALLVAVVTRVAG